MSAQGVDERTINRHYYYYKNIRIIGDIHLDFHTAPELWLTSSSNAGLHPQRIIIRTIREPRTSTLTFTQLLRSERYLTIYWRTTFFLINVIVHEPDVHTHKIQICFLTAYIIYNTIHKYTHAVKQFYASPLRVSNWILTSCQPHRVTPRQPNSVISKFTFQNSSNI